MRRQKIDTTLEFRSLLLTAINGVEWQLANCNIERNKEDDAIQIEFNNYAEYNSAKRNQYYIYRVIEEDCNDDQFKLTLRIKPEFKVFNSRYYIENCKPYKKLFGITISIPLKRLMLFFYNICDKDVVEYTKECPEPVMNSIQNYLTMILYKTQRY